MRARLETWPDMGEASRRRRGRSDRAPIWSCRPRGDVEVPVGRLRHQVKEARHFPSDVRVDPLQGLLLLDAVVHIDLPIPGGEAEAGLGVGVVTGAPDRQRRAVVHHGARNRFWQTAAPKECFSKSTDTMSSRRPHFEIRGSLWRCTILIAGSAVTAKMRVPSGNGRQIWPKRE